MSEYIRPEGGKVLDEHDKCPYCGADLMEFGSFYANYGECNNCGKKWSETPGKSTNDMAFDHCPKCNSKNVYSSCGSRMHCKDCNTTWYPGDEDQAKTLGGDGSSVTSGGGGGCGGGGGGGCCGGMSQSAANNDGTTSTKTPTPADLAKVATDMAEAAQNMPTALEVDAMKGLTEPAAADVAKDCISKACEGLSDYLKSTKPSIVEDLKKLSSKSGGACGSQQQSENAKKGGSCAAVASSAAACAVAAAPGFQPYGALVMRQLLEAAKKICEEDIKAVGATMATTPAILTMPEGAPATPTIAECLAILGELETSLVSLRLTQEALLMMIGQGIISL